MPDNMSNTSKVLSELIRRAFINLMKETHTTIPGVIKAFNPDLQEASVQVSIKRTYIIKNDDDIDTKENKSVPLLIHVPVVFPRGGGWCITFPVKPGDECVVHFAERSLDLWRKRGGEQEAKDWRMHSYSDAICEVGLSSEPNAITGFNNEDMEIRNEVNDVRIALRANSTIEVISPVKVVVTAPVQEFNASSVMNFNTPTANFSGDVNISGTSTANTDHVSAGKSGASHTHPITSGSSAPGPTGGPQ